MASSTTPTTTIEEAFLKNEIVPNIIDGVPKETLLINFGSIEISLGNFLKPSEASCQPTIKWSSDPNKYYTLIHIDPDAPSRSLAILSPVNHWLVVNIPGDDINAGEILADYGGPGPPPGSGRHRYIYLLYEQNSGKLTFDENPIPKNVRSRRMKFQVREFIKKYNLGEPIAGNFFFSQSDTKCIIQ